MLAIELNIEREKIIHLFELYLQEEEGGVPRVEQPVRGDALGDTQSSRGGVDSSREREGGVQSSREGGGVQGSREGRGEYPRIRSPANNKRIFSHGSHGSLSDNLYFGSQFRFRKKCLGPAISVPEVRSVSFRSSPNTEFKRANIVRSEATKQKSKFFLLQRERRFCYAG